jgi:hypothetical protein
LNAILKEKEAREKQFATPGANIDWVKAVSGLVYLEGNSPS